MLVIYGVLPAKAENSTSHDKRKYATRYYVVKGILLELGDFDKRGLPDPLVIAFYFTVQSDLIVQLIILRNRNDI